MTDKSIPQAAPVAASEPSDALRNAIERVIQCAPASGWSDPNVIDQLRAALAAALPTPQAAPVAAEPLTDAEIQRIAEQIGEEIPGRRNYDAWGSHYYRRDEEGNFNIPMVPPNALPFARAIEATVMRAMKGAT